ATELVSIVFDVEDANTSVALTRDVLLHARVSILPGCRVWVPDPFRHRFEATYPVIISSSRAVALPLPRYPCAKRKGILTVIQRYAGMLLTRDESLEMCE